MKAKRRIVETLTEFILAFVLLGIVGISFAALRDVNPVAKKELAPVLGASISSLPWEFKQDATFEQTNVVETEKSFIADYNLAISRENPVSSFTLFTLNNASAREEKYRIVLSATENELKPFKVSGLIAKKDKLIYDGNGEGKYYNLEITLPPRTSQDFSLLVNPLTEKAPGQLTVKVNVQMP